MPQPFIQQIYIFNKSYFRSWGVSVLTEWYLTSFLCETPGDPCACCRGCWHSTGTWLRVLARLLKPCWGDSRAGSSAAWLSESLDRSSEEPRSLKELSEMGKASFSHTDGSWQQTDSSSDTWQGTCGIYTSLIPAQENISKCRHIFWSQCPLEATKSIRRLKAH